MTQDEYTDMMNYIDMKIAKEIQYDRRPLFQNLKTELQNYQVADITNDMVKTIIIDIINTLP